MRRLRKIVTNGVELEVHVTGEGPLCVLVHGWPETWWSWRHQIEALVGAGYQVAAPNIRGYGASASPDAVEAYGIETLAADVVGLVHALGHERAVFIGHDWGAPIAWTAALRHPDIVRAVVGLSVPHLGRRGPMPPTELFQMMHANRFFYVLYFQEPGVAEAEFEADVRGSLARIYLMNSADSTPEIRAAMRARRTRYLEGVPMPERLPAWLTEQDLQQYVDAFEHSGFRGGLNRYRCMDRDWHGLEDLSTARIAQPALFIVGEHDSVLRYAPGVDLLEVMEVFYSDLRGKILIEGAGHWVQQERPSPVNAALLGFLAEL